MISHLIGRQVWLDGSVFMARPNMYIALVGNPGLKKSTAMKIASKMVHLVNKDIKFAPDSITKEAIMKIMGEENSVCRRVFERFDKKHDYRQLSVFADEFVNLINSGGNAPGMIELLTGVWDTDYYSDGTKNKGSYPIPNPYVPILGCLTTETVKKLMSEKVISTGMSRRILFIVAERNGPPQPRPSVSPEQQAAYDRCISHGAALQSVVGEYVWSDDTIPLWDDWYKENYKRAEDDQAGDSPLINFLMSKPVYVTKVSILLALCDYERYQERILHPRHFTKALELVTAEEQGGSSLFAGAGRNELAPITLDIKKLVEQSPEGIPRAKLVARFNSNATPDEMGKILSYLTTSAGLKEWSQRYGTKDVNVVGTEAHYAAWLGREKKRQQADLPAVHLPSSDDLT